MKWHNNQPGWLPGKEQTRPNNQDVPGREAPVYRLAFKALLLLLMFLTACVEQPTGAAISPGVEPVGEVVVAKTPTAGKTLPTPSPTSVTEIAVRQIPISGPVAQAKAEVSGMDWYGDWLVLLPQYPARINTALFAIKREDIIAYLDGDLAGPLTPQAIPFSPRRMGRYVRGFEGFEAIAFHGEEAYLAIEASPSTGMKSYLAKGRIAQDLSKFVLDTDSIIEAPLPVQISNFSNEALTIQGDRLYVFYEANGTGAAPSAHAAVYDLDLTLLGTLEMDQLEYRLTDATAVDEAGRFWVSNFFFLGDLKIIPRSDTLATQFGQGPTHKNNSVVERLVELQLPTDGKGPVTFSGRAPAQLQLSEGLIPRNWEGIARLDGRGFLLVTDKYPETMLGFVPYPE